ncbi:hypothetical protein CCS92_34355, partial [Methylobacterium radiotolerans]
MRRGPPPPLALARAVEAGTVERSGGHGGGKRVGVGTVKRGVSGAAPAAPVRELAPAPRPAAPAPDAPVRSVLPSLMPMFDVPVEPVVEVAGAIGRAHV